MRQSTKTIVAFFDVLETQNSLFSDALQDLSKLGQQIMALADEQYDEMASAIKSFCKNYPPIRDAVRSKSGTERAAGGTSPVEITPEDERKLRDQLINLIRLNTPVPSPESKPKPDSTQSSR